MNVEELKSVPVFSDLTDAEAGKILKNVELKSYGKEDIIFSEGDPADYFHIIKTGRVKIAKKIDDKKMKTLTLLDEGNFFGEIALIDSGKRSASALAATDCELYEIDGIAFREMIESESQTVAKVLRAILKEISNRIRSTNEQFKDLLIWGLASRK